MRSFLIAALTVFVFVRDSSAGDWPHWRGPSRNGVIAESSGWNGQTWLEERPAWTAEVGEGASSPIVVKDRVYTLGWSNSRDVLCCLDAAAGKELWKTDYPCPQWGRFHEGDEGFYTGPSSTPEFDPESGRLFTLSIDGDLNTWDTKADGRRTWSLNLYKAFGVKRRPRLGRAGLRDYGYTSCPLRHGKWLLVEVGAPEGTLVAFDPKTGEKAWASECADAAGHNAGPAPITVEGIPCVALLTIQGLVVIRLDDANAGKTVARFPWITDFANNIASASVHGDSVLITSAYNHGKICRLRITLRGAEKVWETPYPSKVCTPVVHKGCVYLAWEKVRCLDWKTGEQKWEGGSVGDPGSCVVTSDDRLVVYGHNGRLSLVETAERSPARYTELARRGPLFASEAWPHVVVANGFVLCRDRLGNLVCLKKNR